MSDNGPEFCSWVVDPWGARQIQLRFIRPGKPIENAYVESSNGRCRDECFNEQLFVTIDEARANLDHWRIDYKGTKVRVPAVPSAT